jgi:ribose 5-phosphate isomerase A
MKQSREQTGPVITDNGNFVIDVDFGIIEDPPALEAKLRNIVGIVETGLFVNMAQKAYFGNENGEVTCR